MVRLTTLLAAFATATCLAATAAAEPPSADSSLCAHGGWHSVQSDHGHRFSNQGSCVSYVNGGRLLFRPSLDLIPRCFSSSLEIEITAAWFHQASLATVTLSGATFLFGGGTERTLTTGTDKTVGEIPGGFKIQPVLAPPLYSTSLVTVTVRDAEGVTLSTGTLMGCAPAH
jgi:hypothetical protein